MACVAIIYLPKMFALSSDRRLEKKLAYSVFQERTRRRTEVNFDNDDDGEADSGGSPQVSSDGDSGEEGTRPVEANAGPQDGSRVQGRAVNKEAMPTSGAGIKVLHNPRVSWLDQMVLSPKREVLTLSLLFTRRRRPFEIRRT